MKIIIIGVGAAGIAAAKTLRQLEPTASILMISIDKQVYSRFQLYRLLSRERTAAALSFIPPDFFEKNAIEWKQEAVTAVNPTAKTVTVESGIALPYDRLLIASGAQYLIPPIPNFRTAANVYGLRDLPDAQAIDAAAENARQVVVVGSGLVGLDAAYALLARGLKVTVVEMADRVASIQLDHAAAQTYQDLFADAGCSFALSRKAVDAAVDENNRITSITLDNGTILPCDFLVVAVGVCPAISFLKDSGIHCTRSVSVDDFMQTNIPDVFAAGDVAGLSGTWANASKQGEIAAKNMVGVGEAYADRDTMKNSMNYYDLPTLSLGRIQTVDGDGQEIVQDHGTYKKAIMRDGFLEGVLLQGDVSNALTYQKLIKERIPLQNFSKSVFAITKADF